MRTRRTGLLFRRCGIFLAVAFALVACGVPRVDPPNVVIASAPTQTATPIQPNQKIAITTTNAPDPNNPAEVARHKLLVGEFNKLRPDVTVEAHQVSFSRELLVEKLANGTMEDAYLVPFTEPQDLIAKGYAADITDLIKGWDNFYSFNPDLLKIVQDKNGRIYGIPVGGYALGIVYNRKLFEQAGLFPDIPPTTWEQVRDYARKLTDDARGRKGFVELSAERQGGWHFAAWSYSFGGELERQDGDRWRAAFDQPANVEALKTIQAMRWTDRTMVEAGPLTVKDALKLLAEEKVAMAIMAPDALPTLKAQFGAKIADFGIGPLPQGGGNATLTGGAAWLFNPRSSPEVLKAAFEWTINRDFNLSAFESDLKDQAAKGGLVGWPQLPLFGGDFQQERNAIMAKYTNAPTDNYLPYVRARLQSRPEPPVETQKMYTELDTVMSAVLTNPNADPQQLLRAAGERFQRTVLDQRQR